MYADGKLFIAKAEDRRVCLLPHMANRHGLIAGATGTGKTITLKVMAESFSDLGVPVFLADVKGDLAGMCLPGEDTEGIRKRIARFALDGFTLRDYPAVFWDVYGQAGHPVRTTASEMGPLLLARLLNLTDAQAGVLNIVFRVADDRGLLLLDMKDLRAMVQEVQEHAREINTQYGLVSSQSAGAVLRAVLALEEQGGDLFFGEPALDVADWMRLGPDGRGYINILHCETLFQNPALYSTFLLWLLSELYERLSEAGDLAQPRMVFFFDEAHLLFDDAPKVLLQKIEQVVRLIRSKGVGVYFITQSPSDIPGSILAQLGNRVQHALRAYTPAEQKAVKVAADTFRANPAFKTADVITELGVGEALVSFLDEEGRPGVVERAFILPPQSKMGAVEDAVRRGVMARDGMGERYDFMVDRESAYEYLLAQHEREDALARQEADRIAWEKEQRLREKERLAQEKEYERRRREAEREAERRARQRAPSYGGYGYAPPPKRRSTRQSPVARATNKAADTIGREVGKSLVRGLMGNLFR